MTSNPSIFEKAILGSPDYDDDARGDGRGGQVGAEEIYDASRSRTSSWRRRRAAPGLGGTDHADGFVSLEVEPELARDTEGTLAQARAFGSASTGPT